MQKNYNKIFWNMLLVVSLIFIAIVFYKLSGNLKYEWHWEKVPWAFYPIYTFETVKLAAFSCVFGIIIGIPFGIGRIMQNPLLHWISVFYIEIIKRVPLLIQVFLVGAFFVEILEFDNYPTAVIVLSIYTSFQAAEKVYKSISTYQQTELKDNKKNSLTLSELVKRICFQFLYLFVHLIKESALISFISVPELFGFTKYLMSSYELALEAILITALVYFTLTFALSQLLGVVRKSLFKDETYFNNPKMLFLS